jgi:hypothetical protein
MKKANDKIARNEKQLLAAETEAKRLMIEQEKLVKEAEEAKIFLEYKEKSLQEMAEKLV